MRSAWLLLFAVGCSAPVQSVVPPESDDLAITVDSNRCRGLRSVSGERRHVEQMVAEWCGLHREGP